MQIKFWYYLQEDNRRATNIVGYDTHFYNREY